MCACLSRKTPTGYLAHNLGMCPDWELDWQPFGLQASTQFTEPQLGQMYRNLTVLH